MRVIQTFIAISFMTSVAEASSFEKGLRSVVQYKSQLPQTFSIESRMKHYGVPSVSVAIIRDGKVIESRSFGTRTDVLFQAGSVSKLVTAVGALKLVESGKIRLDQDVSSLLQGWKIPESKLTLNEKVTLRRLLSHSAGINVPGFAGYTAGATLPSLIEILNGKPPANSDPIQVILVPGSQWKYSGGGTTIIQRLIESVTGQSFSEWMKKNVLDPLGMKNSVFSADPPGAPFVNEGHRYPELAAAGLWSTAEELAKVHPFFFPAKPSSLIQEALSVQKGPSGLGPMVRLEGGVLIAEHEGVNVGFVSLWHGWKKDSNTGGAVIMTNAQNGEFLIPEILSAIADQEHWNHLKPKWLHPSKVRGSLNQIHALAGRYKKAGEENYLQILANGRELSIQFNPNVAVLPLIRENEFQYYTPQGAALRFKGVRIMFTERGSKSDWIKVKSELKQ